MVTSSIIVTRVQTSKDRYKVTQLKKPEALLIENKIGELIGNNPGLSVPSTSSRNDLDQVSHENDKLYVKDSFGHGLMRTIKFEFDHDRLS